MRANSIHTTYPYGMLLPERNGNATEDEYRYAFNGMTADEEIKGERSNYDFGARMYDPRLGRFLLLDPYAINYPGESPFIFAGNVPILMKDYEGKFKIIVTKEALQASGLTKMEIKRFKKVISELNSYLNQNPKVLAKISEMTKMTNEQILDHTTDGKGPTIFITVNNFGAQAPPNRVDNTTGSVTAKDGIEIDFSLVQWFEKHKGTIDEETALDLLMGGIVLHEYTHWGDRKNNKGKVTGQNPVDPGGDIYFNGVQKNRSKAPEGGHRGSDTEHEMYGIWGVSIESNIVRNEFYERVSGSFYITQQDINVVIRNTTSNPDAKPITQKNGQTKVLKKRLPKDMGTPKWK